MPKIKDAKWFVRRVVEDVARRARRPVVASSRVAPVVRHRGEDAAGIRAVDYFILT